MTSTPSWGLWVTRQALADIGLERVAGSTFDLEAMTSRHPILKAFKNKRGSDPRGIDKMQKVKRDIYNLHTKDPFRAVTWYDEVQDVVFLLAVSSHDYSVFENRDEDGTLGPLDVDYADYLASLNPIQQYYDDFLERARIEMKPLLERASDNPGKLVEATLGQELPVAMMVQVLVLTDEHQMADVHVAISFKDRKNTVKLPPDVAHDLVDIFFPDANLSDVDIGKPAFPDPEVAKKYPFPFRWRRP